MKKLGNNWRYKTLEDLENEMWAEPAHDSQLVTRCHALRKIPLKEFTVEDLRIMIGQQIGLPFLLPLALEILTENLFAEGDFFEGDLLQNVLRLEPDFWKKNNEYYAVVKQMIDKNRQEITGKGIKIDVFDSV